MQVTIFWMAYAAFLGVALVGTVATTRRLAGRWARHALIALVVAVFVAPSFVIKGHGIGPAWMAALDAGSVTELALYGVLPVAVTWALMFGVLRLAFRSAGPPT